MKDPTDEQVPSASEKLAENFNKANEGMDVEWVKKRGVELFSFVQQWVNPTDLGYVLYLSKAKTSMIAVNHAMEEAERKGQDVKEGLLDFASEMLAAVLSLYAIAEGRMMADVKQREREANKDERTVIICDPASIPPTIPGTSEGKCSECETAINVAPSSRAFIEKRPDVALLCGECGIKAAEESDEVVTAGRVPGVEPQPKKPISR